ncbi:Apolipoprotein N-acyltransferase (EC 2.3.1.-) / Copper homeostasis protein CutE [uncultured Gammaproteobacteria bacterium]|nr:Apolipoprotein N-acyltransferase (EC 2.3.1.-) / Copper homeostasis protein CutE [uncultured Gammaproteobacteria bacterium]CAC9960826.1 Apolipoprotein N-acyltransferase (EC 2.3.1.-) / Copper homeostasis protein CutE [uncultured Gammaproteobacteria bacterium]
MVNYLLVVFAGLITPFAFAPFNYVPTIFISHIILFWLIFNSKDNKQAFKFGLVFGLSEYLLGFYWMFSIVEGYDINYQIVMSIIILGIIIIITLLLGLSSYIIKRFSSNSILYYALFTPSIFTLYEWIKSWLFTGFPWYASSDSLDIFDLYSLLPIIGYLGLCFIFYIFIGICTYLIKNYKNKIFYFLLFAYLLLLAFAVLFVKNINWTTDIEKTNIRIITGDFDLNQKNNRYEVINRFDKYKALSNTQPTADITVWPESTISIDYQDIEKHIDSNDLNTNVFSGVYYQEKDGSKNTIFDFKEKKPVYYKEHLIPFGEYTPWWFTLLKPFLPKFNMDNLTASSNEAIFTINNIKAFGSICFEILFSTELLDRSKDANIHIHISDLGWFDNTIAIDYLLNIARMRAIETSKPMIYSVNKGYSAFIDHRGEIMHKQSSAGLYMLNQTLSPQQGTTFYTEYKNAPLLGTIMLLFIIFAFHRGKKNKITQ